MKESIKTYPIMLPTSDASPLGYHFDIKLDGEITYAPQHGFKKYDTSRNFQHRPQHLYLISDREIRVGDFYYNEHYSHDGQIYRLASEDSVLYDGTNRKVEASTKLLSVSNHLVNTFLTAIPVKTIEDWVSSQGTLKEVILEAYTDCPNCEMCDSAVMNRDCDICKGEGFIYLKTTNDNKVIEAIRNIVRELTVKTTTGTSKITLTFNTDDKDINDKQLDNIVGNIITELKGELL